MKRHVDTAPQGRADPASVKTITDNTALREIANQFQNAAPIIRSFVWCRSVMAPPLLPSTRWQRGLTLPPYGR
jgi:hypothetical protein